MKKSCFSRLIGSCGLAIALAGMIFPYLASAQYQDPLFSAALGPAVRIVSPANNQVFYAPVDLPIFAYTRLNAGARFTNVEFYANGTNDLGSGIRMTNTAFAVYKTLASPDVMQPGVIARLHGLWCFVWTNAPTGAYAVTAVASGDDPDLAESVMRTSAPVNITITNLPSNLPVPATNIVSIDAIDPIAIAGTNSSWIWTGQTNTTPSWINWPPTTWEYFTNWGPKAALFTIWRCGDISTDLVVNYNLGGTASNGVDYVALPGFVDISAGCAYANIPIVPTDSGSNNVVKTVVLSLLPSTNTPPNYLVGFPPHAEALILYRWPRPLPWLLLDGSFHFNASGPDGTWFLLLNSTDLVNWSCIGASQVFQGSADIIDPNAPNNSSGFYQIVPWVSPIALSYFMELTPEQQALLIEVNREELQNQGN